VSPGAGLDRRGKSHPTGIRSQDIPARSSVAIPTVLPGPPTHTHTHRKVWINMQPHDQTEFITTYLITLINITLTKHSSKLPDYYFYYYYY
jgi:hypothetical protein